MHLNSFYLKEKVDVAALGASAPIGTAAATVDIAAHFGVTASAASLTFTLPNPTSTRNGRKVAVTNTGANPFTMYGVALSANNYAEFIWDNGVWHSMAAMSGADFWRTPTASGALPDGVTDPQDTIERTGQTILNTGLAGDSGLTLDDLRGMTAGYGAPNDGTNVTAIGVDPTGKVRLSNSLYSPDVRAVNDNPDQYAPGYYVEFKQATAVGFTNTPATGPAIGQTHVGLETFRRYGYTSDLSGGPVQQRTQLDDGAEYYRNSTSATTWGPWTVKTNLQSEFDLQDLLQMNGTAKVSLAGQVRWTNRIITMTAGGTPQEPSGYHDINMPADGFAIPVQGGGTRAVVAVTAGQSAATGGIPLNAWETLWYRVPRGTGTGFVPGNFLITYYTSNANTSVPGILNEASYPGTHAGEWLRIVSRDDVNKFYWGTKDTLGLGGQFGGGHDLTIANWTAMKNRAHMDGYAFATFATSLPQRFGMTGTIRWIDGGQDGYLNGQGYVDTTPANRTNGTVIIGVNGAANRTWETVTAADAIAKFGGAQRGNNAITSSATVVQLNDNETLYYAPDIGVTGQNTGSWYVSGYTGGVSIPVHWLPVASYQATGASNTTQVLVGGVQRSLKAGDAVWFGKAEGDIARIHSRMGVTHTGLKYTRFSHLGYFAGAGANALLTSAEAVLISWVDNRMMYGINDGYASWGNQYTWINMPAAGTSIPVATTNGAVLATRIVDTISGRNYIPLGAWESLWFIPPAYVSGNTSLAGDFVITSYLTGNHNVPPGAVRVAHLAHSTGMVGASEAKTRVHWADGTYSQPGVNFASATPALRVENDMAQGTGDWRNVTVAGETGPGMSAALPAVAGISQNNAFYRYLAHDDDPRGTVQLDGHINITANVPDGTSIGFMAGVYPRISGVFLHVLIRHAGNNAVPASGFILLQTNTINGQAGTQMLLYGASAANVSAQNGGAHGASGIISLAGLEFAHN